MTKRNVDFGGIRPFKKIYYFHLGGCSDGDGSIVLRVEVVRKGFWVRSGRVPTFPGEPDRSVDLQKRGPGRLHPEDRNPAELGGESESEEKN